MDIDYTEEVFEITEEIIRYKNNKTSYRMLFGF